KPGERFTGKLLGSLTATNGQIVVPRGAWIEGRIVRVDPDFLPTVRVAFTRIDSTSGPLALRATVRGVSGTYAWANPHAIYDPEGLGYDAILYHPRAIGISTDGRSYVGGGPTPPNAGVDPSELELPKGAELDLVLARPLEIPPPETR